MSRKGTFSKALKHLKSTSIDEKIEKLEESPTNSTIGYMTGTPSETNPNYVDGRRQASALNTKEGDFTVGENPADSTEAKDTTGLFEADGTIRTAEPPGDTSYILGPMAAMYYTWSSPWTRIGYIRQSDRKMQNLGTVTGKLSDWDGTADKFTSYGDLTLEQAQWFRDVQKANGNTNDPDSYTYRAFYPGPPSNTPDAFGRYYCVLTGAPKQSPLGGEDELPVTPSVGRGATADEDFSALADRAMKHGLSRRRAGEMSEEELEDFVAQQDSLQADIDRYSKEQKDLEKEARDIAIGFGVDVALTLFGGAILKGAAVGIGAAVKGARALNKARQVAKVANTLQKGSKISKAAATAKATTVVNRANNIKKSAEASRKAAQAAQKAQKAAQAAANKAKPGSMGSPYPKGYKGPTRTGKLTGKNIDGTPIKQIPRGQPGSSTSPYPKGYKGPQTKGPLTGKTIPKSTTPKSTTPKSFKQQVKDYINKGKYKQLPDEDTASLRKLVQNDIDQMGKFIKPASRNKLPKNLKPSDFEGGPLPMNVDQLRQFLQGKGGLTWSFSRGASTGPTPLTRQLLTRGSKGAGNLTNTAIKTFKNNPVRTGVYGSLGVGAVKSGIDTQKSFNKLLNDGGKGGLSTIEKIDSMISPNKNVDTSELETSVKSIEKELGKQAGDDVRKIVTTTPKEIQSNLSKIKNLNPKRSDFPDTKSYNEALKLANIISGKYSPDGIKVAGKVYLNYIAGTLPKVIDNNYLGQPYVNRLWTDMDLTSDGKVTSGDAVVGSGQKPVVDGDELVAGFNYDFNTNQEEIASDPQKFIDAGPFAMFVGLAAGLGNPYALDSHPLPPAGILTWASKKTGIGGDHRPGEIRIKISDLKLRNRSFYNQLIRNGTIKESSNIGYKINSRVLNNLHERVVLPEGKKKSYKVRPGQKYKSPVLAKKVETPKEFRNNIGAPDTWGKAEYDQNVRSSQEKKNELMSRLYEGDYAFNYAVNGGTKMKSPEEMDAYWKEHPDLYSYYHSGQKYKLLRKEQVAGDYLVFLIDEKGNKINILQSVLNEKIAEEAEKDAISQYMKENSNTEPISYEKDPMVTRSGPTVKDVAKRLKGLVDYEGKPSPKGYPSEPPPKMIDGWHPKFGKKYKYDKLDPVSARAMPKQGDPEIDANIDKASNQPKTDGETNKKKSKVSPKFKMKEGRFSDWRSEEKEVRLKEANTTSGVFSYKLVGSDEDLGIVQTGFDGEAVTAVTSFTDIAHVSDPHNMGTNIRTNQDPNLVPTPDNDGNHSAYLGSGPEGWSGGFRGIDFANTSTETNENQPVDTNIVTGHDGPYISGQVGAHLAWGLPGNPGYPRFAALKAVDTTDMDTISINWMTRGIVVQVDGEYVARDDTDFTEPGDGIYLFYWAGDKEGAAQYAGNLNAALNDHDGWRPVNVKPDGTTDSNYSPLLIPHKAEGYKGNRFFKNDLTLPPWTRDENTRFIIVQIDNHSGTHKARWGMSSVRFKRQVPRQVFAALDKPEAISFVRVGTQEGDPKKRKEAVEDQLKASKQYTNKVLGKDFPGMGAALDTQITKGINPIGQKNLSKNFKSKWQKTLRNVQKN